MAARPLVWKLAPSYMLVAAAAVALACVLISRIVPERLLADIDENLAARATVLTRPVAEHLADGRLSELDAWCKELGVATGDRFTVIAPDGAPLADAIESPDAMANLSATPDFQAALARGEGFASRYSQALGQDVRYYARTIGPEDNPVAVLRTGMPLSGVRGALLSVYAAGIAGLVAALALAGATSWYVARRVRRPLMALSAGARRFASGDFRTLSTQPDSSEFLALTQNLNAMAQQLDARFRREIEERHEQDAILESMVEGVVAVDNQERIISLNGAAAALLHTDVSSAPGKPLIEAIRNADLENFARLTLDSDRPLQTEIELHGDTVRYLEIKGAVLRDTHGVSMGAVFVLNDVTRLRKLERVRQDFVSNVSHELRTPLTAIKGFVETLQHSAIESPEDAKRFLGLVAKHVDRLNAIIEDLTSLSRIEREDQEDSLAFGPCNLRQIIDNALQVSEAASARKEIRVDVICSDDLFVRANEALLEQCFVNLLDNALKYSPAGSRVEIRASVEGSDVAIAIADEGIGIPKDDQERIFERFYRVDKGRSRDAGGTGLGLSIVRHIVHLHQGRIRVDSRVGVGTTFTVSIPIAKEAPVGARAP